MSAYDNAKAFFDACETPAGWEGCKQYVADDATFAAQCEPLAEMTSIEEYADWMKGFGTVTAPGATYDLHASAWDESSNTAIFFATFNAVHSGEGGPVPPTGKETHTDYVYAITMNGDGQVAKMIKIWNPTWALTELGWT
jgi:hypothetical protein